MAKLTKRHIEYLNDSSFLEKYLLRINSKLVYSNNRVESNNKERDTNNALSLDDNFKALNILIDKLSNNEDKKITQDLIKKVANTINAHAMYISNNYRLLDNNVSFEGKYPIEKAKNIPDKLEELLNNYYNKWQNIDIFEREALFNIEFLRIHPFEDGNGRTSRLLLNYNMLLNGHAPILMKEDTRKEYFKARNRKDIKWIKSLFEKESQKELKELDRLIEAYESEKNNSRKK